MSFVLSLTSLVMIVGCMVWGLLDLGLSVLLSHYGGALFISASGKFNEFQL